MDDANIAAALTRMAQQQPATTAMIYPQRRYGRTRWVELDYATLDARSSALARGLAASGHVPGTRAAVMLRPGPAFFITLFALFKAGIVPVLIDPGIDRRALRQCLDEAAPQLFIGVPLALCARRLLGWAQRSVRAVISDGWIWPGQQRLAALEALGRTATEPLPAVQAEDIAAILYTSGSTGVPKGVVYRHRMFNAQVQLLREAFAIEPGARNLPTFPPFALFDPALGQTSVIPQMDPRHPARADPRRLLATAARFGCTRMFGSPALLRVLIDHAERTGSGLAGLRHVITAGAPVAPELVERALAVLGPQGRLHTPYGATEALPVAVAEARELLGEVRVAAENGAGICVGRPLAANAVWITAISDGALNHLQPVPDGEIGEICVAGPSVTEAYDHRPQATAWAKLHLDDGRVVHRMGDLGWLDPQGRLWMVGRLAERVVGATRTWYTECVEAIARAEPGVQRCALIGVGAAGTATPVLCVVAAQEAPSWPLLSASLLQRLAAHPVSVGVAHCLQRQRLPVDIRHNAKINRGQLAAEVAALGVFAPAA